MDYFNHKYGIRQLESETEAQHLQLELGMASNHSVHDSIGSENDSKKTNSLSNKVATTGTECPKSKLDELVDQERRTKIAFLENQQAELETEIRLLKQNGRTILILADV